jgi:16S rRNA (guanine527-N7)-methyltransferase
VWYNSLVANSAHGGDRVQYLIEGAAALGLVLTPAQVRAFQRYSDLLSIWNERLNLTSITGDRDIQVKHFLDSLTCLAAFSTERPCRLLDVGSGAGFPGLPLRIYDAGIHVTLLESHGKKAAFLMNLVRELDLADVEIVAERAETAGSNPRYRETFDVVVARAVAELAVLAEYCLPFCRVGGVFVAQKKAGISEELKAAEVAIATLGGALERTIPAALPGLEPRQLVVICKIAPTPAKFPRRPGMPAKRPLA